MSYETSLNNLTPRESRSTVPATTEIRETVMRRSRSRRGATSVELAVVVLFFFIPVLFGIWEAGRLMEVQQLMSTYVREGARLAAPGHAINSGGTPTQPSAVEPVLVYGTIRRDDP